MTTARPIPLTNSPAYRAAAHLFHTGPLQAEVMFDQMGYDKKACRRRQALSRVLMTGWLVEGPRGVDLSDEARAHFAALPHAAPVVKEKYVGQVAAPRLPLRPLYEGQLSAKFRVSSKGNRDDVPAFSVREEGFRSHSVPLGGRP